MDNIMFRLIKDGKVVGYEKHEGGKILHSDISSPELYYNILAVDYKGNTYYYIPHDSKDMYIGIKDKDGEELFEDDVCEFIISVSKSYSREKIIETCDIKSCLYKIEIRNLTAGFIPIFPEFVNIDGKPFYKEDEYWDMEYFKVIGNAHTNPELLEE